ncbi:MAG: hypothetical protein Q7T05_00720 [Dehalococcoidia bacterium]|nr:hypothetical protein [Dehalococcoidia bacterium]
MRVILEGVTALDAAERLRHAYDVVLKAALAPKDRASEEREPETASEEGREEDAHGNVP